MMLKLLNSRVLYRRTGLQRVYNETHKFTSIQQSEMVLIEDFDKRSDQSKNEWDAN